MQLAGALTVLHRHMPHRRVDPSTVLFRHVYDFGQQRDVTGPVLAGVEVAEVADSAGWGPWRSRWASHGVRSGDGAGGRSDDLYSVAALMCSALTRDKPPSYAGKLADPLRPDAPKSLQQLIRRTMDTDPRRRPSSAEVMLHALWEIEDECRLHRTRINGVRPLQPDGVRRPRSTGHVELSPGEPQPGFGPPRGPVILPPPPAPPGRAAPAPAGDPPGGPFPTIGRRPSP